MLSKLLIGILFVIVSALYFRYNQLEYITDKIFLKNGIETVGIISKDEISLLEKIEPFLISGYLYSGGLQLSSNTGIPLEDDLRGYSFINPSNQKDILLIRSSVYHTWRVDEPCYIEGGGSKCVISGLFNILNITMSIKPKQIKDIVFLKSGQQYILLGTGGSRTQQVIEGP